jgi:hypothetical protein
MNLNDRTLVFYMLSVTSMTGKAIAVTVSVVFAGLYNKLPPFSFARLIVAHDSISTSRSASLM